MNVLMGLKLIGIAGLVVLGLSACDKPGPAEKAGKQIDQSVENAGKKLDAATDKLAVDMAEQSNKAGVVIDDVEITTKVKAAIFAEAGLKTLQISVDTIKGVVTLSGSVNSQAHSDTAKALASAVSGVSKVVNNLSIKKTS
jgi:osmotically-inducible protein OsmY